MNEYDFRTVYSEGQELLREAKIKGDGGYEELTELIQDYAEEIGVEEDIEQSEIEGRIEGFRDLREILNELEDRKWSAK